MQVELPGNTPVDDWIYLVLNIYGRDFLDTYLFLAAIEFLIRAVQYITM